MMRFFGRGRHAENARKHAAAAAAWGASADAMAADTARHWTAALDGIQKGFDDADERWALALARKHRWRARMAMAIEWCARRFRR